MPFDIYPGWAGSISRSSSRPHAAQAARPRAARYTCHAASLIAGRAPAAVLDASRLRRYSQKLTAGAGY